MSEPLVAGAHVTPTIRLARPLGSGGMGTVWVADHQALRCQVVVKLMLAGAHADPGQVARFSREAAAASRVKSPHVVQVFDHGVTATGTPFIVMELLEGEDLSAMLARRGRLSLVEVVDLVGQVALALTRAHGAHVVHRDVKPGNIFVCDRGDGRPFYKVLDFGIAKGGTSQSMHGMNTQTGAVIGTPAFASPEQLVASKDVDHRTDLWALGVVAFKALTGALPFRGDSLGALTLAIHTTPLPQATSLVPGLPAAMDAWFTRACAVSPKDRFATAQDMANAIRAAADDDAAPSTIDAIASMAAPPSRTLPLGNAMSSASVADRAQEEATQTSAGEVVAVAVPVPTPVTVASANGNAGGRKKKSLELTTAAPASFPVDEGGTWKAPRPLLPLMLGGAVVLIASGGLALFLVKTPKENAGQMRTGAPITPASAPITPAAAPPPAIESTPTTTTASSATASAAHTALVPSSSSTQTVARPPRPTTTTRPPAAPTTTPTPTTAPTPTPTNAGKLF